MYDFVIAPWYFAQLSNDRFKFYYFEVPKRYVGEIGRSIFIRRPAKSLCASRKRPFYRSCEAMAFSVQYRILIWCVVLLTASQPVGVQCVAT